MLTLKYDQDSSSQVDQKKKTAVVKNKYSKKETHTYTHVYTHKHIHTYIYTHTQIPQTHTHMLTHIYKHIHIHAYIHTFIHTYIHICTNTHIYSHTTYIFKRSLYGARALRLLFSA